MPKTETAPEATDQTVDAAQANVELPKPTEEQPPIAVALARVSKEVGAIAKDRKNDHHGYSFRGVDQVYDALHAPMSRHGIILTSKVVNRDIKIQSIGTRKEQMWVILDVEFTFHGPAGDSLTTGPFVGMAADSDDKAANKALSQAFKYAMFQAFTIPIDPGAVDDGDAASPVSEAPEVTPQERAAAIVARQGWSDDELAFVLDKYETGVTDPLELNPEIAEKLLSHLHYDDKRAKIEAAVEGFRAERDATPEDAPAEEPAAPAAPELADAPCDRHGTKDTVDTKGSKRCRTCGWVECGECGENLKQPGDDHQCVPF